MDLEDQRKTADYTPIAEVTATTHAEEEELFDHLGLTHLESIGSASSSLGLISTLVFGICLGSMIGTDFHNKPFLLLYLCVATTASAYTICYSFLEFYYTQMFKGVDAFISNRTAKESTTRASIMGATKSSRVTTDRAQLTREVREVFATFNTMRGAARNSMWLGLLSLVFSAMTEIDIMSDLAPDLETSSSTNAAMFFASFFSIVFGGWYCFRSLDLKVHCLISGCGFIISATDAWFIQSGFPTTKLVGLLILASMIGILPYTVASFRGPLLSQVKKYVDVY